MMNDRNKSTPKRGRDDDQRRGQALRGSADSGSGFVADDSAGYSSVGGQNEQREATSGRYTNFNSASPESNVGPAGAPQTSHGNAGGPVPGGTVEKAEGSQGQQNRQQDEVAMAGGGNPSDAAAADGGLGNRAGTDDDSDKLDQRRDRDAGR
ncbi:hypothetical protein J8847_06135 [Massilia sp. AB1]|nr:hypothetical protein [Massilia sp. AB1]